MGNTDSMFSPNRLISIDAMTVRLYWFFHDEWSHLRQSLTRLLSSAEIQHMGKYHFDRDRLRYALSHGMLRTLISEQLGMPPEFILFQAGKNGKPYVDETQNTPGIQFNLSHSGEVVLIAIGAGREIGVDVEEILPLDDMEEILSGFASEEEARHCLELDREARLPAFYSWWTKREALAKMNGSGLADGFKTGHASECRLFGDIIGRNDRTYCYNVAIDAG